MTSDSRLLFASGLLALGVAVGGWAIGHGFIGARTGDRFVTVKGLAERPVEADLALWPIRFVVTNDDLGAAQDAIERHVRTTLAFLARHGIDTTQVRRQELQVTDVLANPYRSGPVGDRYILNQQLMVRSTEPNTVLAASQRVGELVQAGVVLSNEGGYSSGPTYLFTRLNEFKPEMIAEATASAREAAEQFAADSRSRLGAIRRASQGLFAILPRDQAAGISEESQVEKTIRVVTTVDYYLED